MSGRTHAEQGASVHHVEEECRARGVERNVERRLPPAAWTRRASASSSRRSSYHWSTCWSRWSDGRGLDASHLAELESRRPGNGPRSSISRCAAGWRPVHEPLPQQLAPLLFEEFKLSSGRRGKTGVFDGRPGPESDSRPASDRPHHRGEARVTKLRVDLRRRPPRAHHETAACTPRSTRPSRPPAGCRRSTPTCRTFRSAPRRAARSAPASWPRMGVRLSRPTTRRSSCACSRMSPTSPFLNELPAR